MDALAALKMGALFAGWGGAGVFVFCSVSPARVDTAVVRGLGEQGDGSEGYKWQPR